MFLPFHFMKDWITEKLIRPMHLQWMCYVLNYTHELTTFYDKKEAYFMIGAKHEARAGSSAVQIWTRIFLTCAEEDREQTVCKGTSFYCVSATKLQLIHNSSCPQESNVSAQRYSLQASRVNLKRIIIIECAWEQAGPDVYRIHRRSSLFAEYVWWKIATFHPLGDTLQPSSELWMEWLWISRPILAEYVLHGGWKTWA